MPNVREMNDRFQSHLARVSGKAMKKEMDRIDALRIDRKISHVTVHHMISTAAIRLAWKANSA
ncbi:MAG: hypothetical protein RLW68_00965 [Devosia marina]|uniref:hypothetical protein n=1 Tax=Devosia marina TaxID=2683198 RepID=UPI0032ED7225